MNFLQTVQLSHLQPLLYAAVFVGMFFDAVITTFTTIFFVSTSKLSGYIAIPLLAVGIYSEQLFYYWLGTYLNRHERLTAWAKRLAAPFDRHLQHKTFRTLLISKFVYGLHRAVLIRSGMLGLPKKFFAKQAVTIGAIWLLVVGGLAFLFGRSYEQFKRKFGYAEAGVVVMLIIILVSEYFISKKLKKDL